MSAGDEVRLRVNGRLQVVNVELDTPLLYVLRDHLGLRAAKYGCGLGQCGACKVIVAGQAVCSCLLPVEDAQDRDIVTLEGIGSPENPHPLQSTFLEANAGQCGYCISGILMAAKALLDRKAHASREEIVAALDENLCRCGSHCRYVRAVEAAGRKLCAVGE